MQPGRFALENYPKDQFGDAFALVTWFLRAFFADNVRHHHLLSDPSHPQQLT